MFSNTINLSVISNPQLSREGLSEVLKDKELLQTIYAENYHDIFGADKSDFVLWHSNSNMCGTYAPRLLEELRDKNIAATTATSYESISSYHVYVVLYSQDGLLILDPSIGQYLPGYKGVYMGTPSELHAMITDPSTELHHNDSSREDFYSRTWGHAIGTAFKNRLRIV